MRCCGGGGRGSCRGGPGPTSTRLATCALAPGVGSVGLSLVLVSFLRSTLRALPSVQDHQRHTALRCLAVVLPGGERPCNHGQPPQSFRRPQQRKFAKEYFENQLRCRHKGAKSCAYAGTRRQTGQGEKRPYVLDGDEITRPSVVRQDVSQKDLSPGV